jgi:hypothetical protein
MKRALVRMESDLRYPSLRVKRCGVVKKFGKLAAIYALLFSSTSQTHSFCGLVGIMITLSDARSLSCSI